MNTINIKTIKQKLSTLEAKEIFYFKWNSNQLYTIMAGDGKKYGNITTLGYLKTNELKQLYKLNIPIYNYCPFN